MIDKTKKGYIYALLCVFLWSLIPVVARFGQAQLDNFQFLFWSNCLSLVVIITCGTCLKSFKKIREAISIKNFIYMMMLGGLGCAFYYLCLYYGYAHGNGIEVLVIQYSWPIQIAILAMLFLKEKISIKSSLFMIIGFTGILTVLTKGNLTNVEFSNPFIILIVFIGTLGFSMFSVLSKKFTIDAIAATTIYFIGGVILSTISLLMFSKLQLPAKSEYVSVFVNGAFINGISYIFWIQALRNLKTSKLTPIIFLSPVLSTIYISLFFNEAFHISYIIGFVLVIIAGIMIAGEKQHD